VCEHGDTVTMRVPVSAGGVEWGERQVDRCVSDLVQALNDAGLYTAGACCGHGRNPGDIPLHDGRWLHITDHPWHPPGSETS
jgi:hypothetical protein